MSGFSPTFPLDQLAGIDPDIDVSADYLELLAWFSLDRQAQTSSLIDAWEIGADEDYEDVDEEVRTREELSNQTINHVLERKRLLGGAYPFSLDDTGDLLSFTSDELTVPQAAYLICLLLSSQRSVSQLLSSTRAEPTDADLAELRKLFQYIATAALAGEVSGRAWSFGFPRPDGTGFSTKLKEVFNALNDGLVSQTPARGAPDSPKDDQIDVFAARPHEDSLPGFIFAAAQVATGSNWREKSLVGHLRDGFFPSWFNEIPVTRPIPYHIVPFTRRPDDLRGDVRKLGNVLHRTRIPRRVADAAVLVEAGLDIEAFDLLPGAVSWVEQYRRRLTQDVQQ